MQTYMDKARESFIVGGIIYDSISVFVMLLVAYPSSKEVEKPVIGYLNIEYIRFNNHLSHFVDVSCTQVLGSLTYISYCEILRLHRNRFDNQLVPQTIIYLRTAS